MAQAQKMPTRPNTWFRITASTTRTTMQLSRLDARANMVWPAPMGRGVVDHEAGVEDLSQNLDPQVLHRQGHGGLVGVEDGKDLGGKEFDDHNEPRRHPDGDPHGHVDHPAGPVKLPRPPNTGRSPWWPPCTGPGVDRRAMSLILAQMPLAAEASTP